MIYIDLENNPPSQDWIDRADIVTQELVDTVDSVLRNQIIDANQPLWYELKNHLSSLNNDKCWYTESINSGAHCHVDHFRPKKEVIDENVKDISDIEKKAVAELKTKGVNLKEFSVADTAPFIEATKSIEAKYSSQDPLIADFVKRVKEIK